MAFEELVKKISPTLRRITYKLNCRIAYLNEEDLLQEALVRLWEDYNAGKLTDKTESYILQGCYFHLKNYIRKCKSARSVISIEVLCGEDGTNLQKAIYLEEESSRRYFDYLNDKLLAEVIMNNGLTPKEKRVLAFCSQDLTTREIGQHLGVSHVRVVKLMAGIRVKCRKYLDS